jgi:hypothetical protein
MSQSAAQGKLSHNNRRCNIPICFLNLILTGIGFDAQRVVKFGFLYHVSNCSKVKEGRVVSRNGRSEGVRVCKTSKP